MKKTSLALASLIALAPVAGQLPVTPTAYAVDEEGDAWEKAANEYNKKVEDAKKQEAAKKAEDTKKQPVIDEEYVKKNIDTPTGKEEKVKEDALKDQAEKKYTELNKKAADAKKEQPKKAEETKKQPERKVLPKTSAVK